MPGWIGVDLDGTLATYPVPIDQIGEPIKPMVARIKEWWDEGIEVRIVTARVAECGERNADGIADDAAFASSQRKLIQAWCIKHLGFALKVTASKDFGMIQLWDDRAIQVQTNTGLTLLESMLDRSPKQSAIVNSAQID